MSTVRGSCAHKPSLHCGIPVCVEMHLETSLGPRVADGTKVAGEKAGQREIESCSNSGGNDTCCQGTGVTERAKSEGLGKTCCLPHGSGWTSGGM
jgi:hypothetical protein